MSMLGVGWGVGGGGGGGRLFVDNVTKVYRCSRVTNSRWEMGIGGVKSTLKNHTNDFVISYLLVFLL